MGVEEKKNRLKKLVGNEQFISGIYNYCDRWCERCTLRTRCLSFAMDPDLDTGDSPRTDPDNEASWQGIHENFQLSFELLLESAEEWGIDLNGIVSHTEPSRDHVGAERDSRWRSHRGQHNRKTVFFVTSCLERLQGAGVSIIRIKLI